MARLLEVRELFAGYGPVDVLRGISIHLDADENIGLFGPNGHGKTTLLKTISGLVRPTGGSITFEGTDITTALPTKIVDAGLVQSPQGNTMFGEMRVQETLELAAFSRRARGKRNDNLRRVFDLFPRLQERGNQRARTLSGGERQMLSIGAALMCEPRLLMLDEPTLGLSPRLKEELSDAIGRIAADGVRLIVVEQDIEFLLKAAGRLYLIEHGEVVQEIEKANAPDHAEIMELYFGKAGA